MRSISRRQFFERSLAAAAAGSLVGHLPSLAAPPASAAQPAARFGDEALVAITLDLEMSRNFPEWDVTHWDYEKGNLDEATKRYAREAARRVKARGGVIHFFAVGRVFEQPDAAWLKEIVDEGHAVGNHTYDHVNVKAQNLSDVQFRFQRAPWLVAGRRPAEVIAENIRLTNLALKERLGIAPAGFRTPGGFNNGLADRPDIQQMLLDLGFQWVSSQYPAHDLGARPAAGNPGAKAGAPPVATPDEAVFDSIVAAQAAAQPFVYPSGLIEVPMSAASDVTAFRSGRWPLESFLEATRRGLTWCLEHGAAYDFLAHPSCLGVVDPEFKTIDLICDLVAQAQQPARIVSLETIAARVANNATESKRADA
ncbi:MAG: polysaccharide deacetylase family protein [Pirellulales bacterium]|nr:polysaccharide deacetylase family protein [Pirellulales bacterium]